ncbi:DUF4345 domain-containing protein [bacterium SCSIO 12643]|nr:DUF4345 domain-containing protein [bacterium SCSIO 12643]
MNYSKVVTGFLVLSGIIGLYVGISLVFFPVELQAQSNIIISNASHFSETRAPGTAILSASLIILIGAFRKNWKSISLLITSLFFLSYSIGRLISLTLDGMPAEGLFYAMIGELFIGVVALILLYKTETPQY